jgi:hypothetical protein
LEDDIFVFAGSGSWQGAKPATAFPWNFLKMVFGWLVMRETMICLIGFALAQRVSQESSEVLLACLGYSTMLASLGQGLLSLE